MGRPLVLTVREEGAEPRMLTIAKNEVVLGKNPDCDAVLADAKVSRRHARLVVDEGRVFVEDLGSTNGTVLDGRPIEGPVALEPDDEVRIAKFTISVKLGDEAVAAPPDPSIAPTGPIEVAAAQRPTDVAHDSRLASLAGWLPKAGPLVALLGDDTVSEIMVNGPSEVFVERAGRLEATEARFESEQQLVELIHRMAADVGREMDERRPLLDARLRDGSRVNAVLPPLALRGAYLTIRRFPKNRLSADELLALGALGRPMLDFLGAAVRGRASLLVSGGTGSGKTTLLSALCSFIGPAERIVTIEDAAELRLPQRHVLPLESKPPDPGGEGEVTIRDLVRNSLRMRPDRIVVGEVRGGEALDMLQAMNTGHEGSLSTIHANSPREALSRLETLVLFAGTDLPPRAIRDQIVTAIRLIVHVSRLPDGRRRVTSIAELTGLEGDQFTTGEIFRFEPAGGGSFQATGYIPRIRDRLVERGHPVDNAWFRKTA